MPENPNTFKVKVNDFEFTIDQATAEKADIFRKSSTEFNILHENRSVNAIELDSDITGKSIRLEVDGQSFDIEIKDHLEQMLDSMGFSNKTTRHIKEIKAPMPGMVLSVAVSEGQAVMEGDRLLILEAMKMENSILMHTDGTIKQVVVTPGQAVDKGQVLVVLD